MRVALDTNVLGYAAGVNDGGRRDRANHLIKTIDASETVLSSQVAGELYNVLVRKGGRTRDEAVEEVEDWIEAMSFRMATPDNFFEALRLARDHKFQIWDALIVCVAAEAGCRLLLSEDMQDGFVYRGVTVPIPLRIACTPCWRPCSIPCRSVPNDP